VILAKPRDKVKSLLHIFLPVIIYARNRRQACGAPHRARRWRTAAGASVLQRAGRAMAAWRPGIRLLSIGFVLIFVVGGILVRVLGRVAGSGAVGLILSVVAWAADRQPARRHRRRNTRPLFVALLFGRGIGGSGFGRGIRRRRFLRRRLRRRWFQRRRRRLWRRRCFRELVKGTSMRLLRHLFTDHMAARRAFPAADFRGNRRCHRARRAQA
jgi:hypothetical protein